MSNPIADDILMHYGTPRHSGRYPYGSGENPYQHTGDFLSRIDELKKQNFTFTDKNGKTWTGETAIAKSMNLSTSEYRIKKSIAKKEKRSEEVATAKSLRKQGYSLNEIAAKMGYDNDSSIRSLLNTNSEARMNQAENTANVLRTLVKDKGMIDVGKGAELELRVSSEKLDQALYILKQEGYNVYNGRVPQATNPGKFTTLKVLAPPGTEHKEIYNFENIHPVTDYISYDGGDTFKKSFVYPASMDSKRLKIRYGDEDDGTGHVGAERDGVIEIRRGVQDLSLGESHYAQVRIMVDGTHYLKGMAVYSDNLPDGVDVVFNTNKKSGTPMHDVLKKVKDDPDNPFGSLIKEHGGQSYYIDKDGNEKLSLINKRAEEKDWQDWADTLPAQFLAKQSKTLINKQLDLATAKKVAEYEKLCSLNNPTIKRAMLKDFADECDSAAVDLKAAALPRQKWKVILPVPSLKDDEVYAPDYQTGEKIALVRYPHGGTFEIPILTVNNKHPVASKALGPDFVDAIGINSKVAERLSGADFDGDTVMTIPCNSPKSKIKIESRPPLKGLEGFDPKLEYGGKPEGTFKQMKNTQTEMGIISNLITDMTLKGAKDDELARAVRHSMVVIDAEKHKLDYKQSEADNGIAALKKRYQGHIGEDGKYHEGASTLISRASSQKEVIKRRGNPIIDPETGKQTWKESREEYIDKNGKVRLRTTKSTKMYETDDAYTLVSDLKTPQEKAYADYANKMKALGNQARKEMLATGRLKYSPSAKIAYAKEVESLNAKLRIAKMNNPRERQAQCITASRVKAKKQANPDLTAKDIKKINTQELVRARAMVGADGKGSRIVITPKEWEAIQAGAISDHILSEIITKSDKDTLRQLATPKQSNTLNTVQANRIKSLKTSGYTIEEIANNLGISTSTVSKYLK